MRGFPLPCGLPGSHISDRHRPPEKRALFLSPLRGGVRGGGGAGGTAPFHPGPPPPPAPPRKGEESASRPEMCEQRSPCGRGNRVKDEKCPDEARAGDASRTCAILRVLAPHPNPLPLGRGGRSRLPTLPVDDRRRPCALRSRVALSPGCDAPSAAPDLLQPRALLVRAAPSAGQTMPPPPPRAAGRAAATLAR